MSLYKRYQTNTNLEKTGVILDIGEARIRIARAGGANETYIKRMDILTKPHRRAIAANSIDRNLIQSLIRQAFAETVILEWETKNAHGQWHKGIEDSEGNILPFTVENVIATLEALPEVFNEIQDFANNSTMYLQSNLEEDAKN